MVAALPLHSMAESVTPVVSYCTFESDLAASVKYTKVEAKPNPVTQHRTRVKELAKK